MKTPPDRGHDRLGPLDRREMLAYSATFGSAFLAAQGLAASVETGNSFSRESSRVWRCMSCGYIHEGRRAPEKCPACVKPSNYFELFVPNW